MQCQKCNVPNDADSKFCKECGVRLEKPPAAGDPMAADRIRIGELIYTAYKHKEAGSIDDAILACQGALALSEESAPAHSLLGSLYETKGDIASAIREYERVLELNPESYADYRKLQDLKSGRTEPPSDLYPEDSVQRLRRYIPYASAGICGIVVFIILLALLRNPVETSQDVGSVTGHAPDAPIIHGATPLPMSPYGNQLQAQYPHTQQGQSQGRQSTSAQSAPGQPSPTGAAPSPPPSAGLRAEPTDGDSSQSTPPRFGGQPFLPAVPERSTEDPVIVPTQPSRSPSADENTPTPSASPAPSPPIVVHHNRTPTASKNPEERAQRLHGEGRYQEAISAYRESLETTNNLGRVHQQMALCYQRLNRHELAIDSYNKAISSYRSQRDAGRDPSEVERDIRACEAGIEVSRGRLNR